MTPGESENAKLLTDSVLSDNVERKGQTAISGKSLKDWTDSNVPQER
jgi:hypothetical protein